MSTRRYKVQTPFGYYNLYASKYIGNIYVATIVYNTFNEEKTNIYNEAAFNIIIENFVSLDEDDLWIQIDNWLKDLTKDKYYIEEII